MPARAARTTTTTTPASAPAPTPIPAPVVQTVAEAPPAAVPGAAGDTSSAVQLSGYRGLKVWQRAMDLAAAIHRVAGTIPDAARARELWDTAVAVPASIAAGNSLYVRSDYVELLSVAHGKVARLECLLHLADRLAALPGTDTAPLLASAGDIGRMLRGLARALQAKVEPDAVETVN
jgi:four helix bundle protein